MPKCFKHVLPGQGGSFYSSKNSLRQRASFSFPFAFFLPRHGIRAQGHETAPFNLDFLYPLLSLPYLSLPFPWRYISKYVPKLPLNNKDSIFECSLKNKFSKE